MALDRLQFNYDYYQDSASERRGNWGRSATINDCDFVKYIIANKTVAHNGEDYVLYLVVIQGTKGGYDWTSNFNLGDTDDHEGFYKASADVMSDIYDQLSNLSTVWDEVPNSTEEWTATREGTQEKILLPNLFNCF